MNPKNAYELQWVEPAEISRVSEEDSKKEPIDRKYAPWVHAIFALPADEISRAFAIKLSSLSRGSTRLS